MTDIVSEVEAVASGAVKTATTFATGHWLIIGAVVGALALGGAGAGYITYKVMDDKIKTMQLAEAEAREQAVTIAKLLQEKTDAAAADAAYRHGVADQKLADNGKVIIKEVPTYVTKYQDAHNCITWGLVRVHDAAALGVDPSTLQLPPGVTNDTCSPFVSSQLAGTIALNYISALRNAKQLDDLTALDRKLDAIVDEQKAATKPKSFWDSINPF